LSARNVLPGTVASLVRQGPFVRANVDIGIPLQVHVTPSSSDELGLCAGRAVWLVVKTHSCHPVTADIIRAVARSGG
jgi:molybdopterin-binding protein